MLAPKETDVLSEAQAEHRARDLFPGAARSAARAAFVDVKLGRRKQEFSADALEALISAYEERGLKPSAILRELPDYLDYLASFADRVARVKDARRRLRELE